MAPGAEVVDLTEDAVVDLVSDDEAIATPPAKRRRVAAPGHGAGAEPALSSSAGGSGWGELASTQGDQDVGALQALHGRGGLRLLQHMVAAGGGGGDPQVLALQTAQLQECIGLLRRRLESTMGERFEPQRITRDQLQAALLRARPPRDPPLADPASQGHFTLLCYNLWCSPRCVAERMAAVGQIVEDKGRPHIILLQEVTHYIHLLLQRQGWFRDYAVSPMHNITRLGESIYTLILWRKDTLAWPIHFEPYRFPNSTLARDVKSVVGWIGGTPLWFACSHLESPMGRERNTEERAAQMAEMLQLLDAVPKGVNCIVGGDMNWLPVDDQDPPAPFPPGRGWCDVWPTLRGGDPGWTYDSQKAPQKGKKYGRGGRLDRIFARLKDWEPAAIELVGTQAIPGLERTVRLGKTERSDRSIRVWPSDHFGLHAVFIKKMG